MCRTCFSRDDRSALRGQSSSSLELETSKQDNANDNETGPIMALSAGLDDARLGVEQQEDCNRPRENSDDCQIGRASCRERVSPYV